MPLLKDRIFYLLLFVFCSLLLANVMQLNYISSCLMISRDNIPKANITVINLSQIESITRETSKKSEIESFVRKVKFKTVLDILPHTTENFNYDPNLEISNNRNATLVIGISTIKREINYLFDTLNSIFSAIKFDFELSNQVLIILSIAEVSTKLFFNFKYPS